MSVFGPTSPAGKFRSGITDMHMGPTDSGAVAAGIVPDADKFIRPNRVAPAGIHRWAIPPGCVEHALVGRGLVGAERARPPERAVSAMNPAADPVKGGAKIGRASCRDRVESAEVAGGVQKEEGGESAT